MADLPQGNDLAGILRQNANYGYRTCEVFKENLTEIDYDIKKHGRYHHLTNNYFDYLHQLHDVPSLQTAFAKEHGLYNIIQRIKENNQLRLNSQAISMIKQCWIKFAICSKAVFAESMSDNDCIRLDATLQNLSIDLLKVKFYLVISRAPNRSAKFR
ncbi:unnamed protein product [Rhizophagus irregularis]|nr:unnamed protein product [Rhizophagus irregularis]